MSHIKDRLSDYHDFMKKLVDYHQMILASDALEMIEQLKDDLEQDEKENGWIPVSERLPEEDGYLLSSATLSACPKNTVIADMVIENILHRKSYRKISRERYIPMNPKDFYGYRRKTVAVLYERMRLLGVWEDK